MFLFQKRVSGCTELVLGSCLLLKAQQTRALLGKIAAIRTAPLPCIPVVCAQSGAVHLSSSGGMWQGSV